jgi:hypothetical protein
MHQKYLKRLQKFNQERYKKGMKKFLENYLTTILLVIVIILLLVIVVLKKTKIKVDSDEVSDIYSLVGSNDIEVCEGLITYADGKVSYDDIDEDVRICIAYSMLDSEETETLKIDKTKKNNNCSINNNITFATDDYDDDICTVTKIDASKINEQYKKVYGKEIESYDSFQLNSTTICNYDAGTYYCGLAETFTYTIGGEPKVYRTIDEVKTKGDEYIIYDYFLEIVNDECYASFTTEEKDESCSNKYSASKLTYKFIKANGTKYKHTFKKDGDNYYWVSSEPVS